MKLREKKEKKEKKVKDEIDFNQVKRHEMDFEGEKWRILRGSNGGRSWWRPATLHKRGEKWGGWRGSRFNS